MEWYPRLLENLLQSRNHLYEHNACSFTNGDQSDCCVLCVRVGAKYIGTLSTISTGTLMYLHLLKSFYIHLLGTCTCTSTMMMYLMYL